MRQWLVDVLWERLEKLPERWLYLQFEEPIGATLLAGEEATSVSSAERLGFDASPERSRLES